MSGELDAQGPTLGVVWRCLRCDAGGTVQCPARDPNVVDVCTWVDQVATLCGVDHMRRSPECDSQHLDLKIPYAKDAYVGQARPH